MLLVCYIMKQRRNTPPLRQRVIDYLIANPGWHSTQKLCTELSGKPNHISRILRELLSGNHQEQGGFILRSRKSLHDGRKKYYSATVTRPVYKIQNII